MRVDCPPSHRFKQQEAAAWRHSVADDLQDRHHVVSSVPVVNHAREYIGISALGHRFGKSLRPPLRIDHSRAGAESAFAIGGPGVSEIVASNSHAIGKSGSGW